MTIEQLRSYMDTNKQAMSEIVQKQTNLICDAYQQGFQDCWNLFSKMLKEKGIEL